MEIRPTTIVKLFSGVPLNPTYSDTLYFSSLSAQSSYFAGLTPVKTFTSQMYQRVNKGQFEANCKADDIYNCNYMAFQNSGFGNKWFYAFINSIEYINNNNSLVTFEIDVMQTWMFDYSVKRSFIERQHSAGDLIGSNILPEPVSLGEYVFDDYDKLLSTLDRFAVLIMIVTTSQQSFSDGDFYDEAFSGAQIYAIDSQASNAKQSINSFIGTWKEKPETIVNMYMCPLYLLPLPSGSISTHEDYYSDVASVPHPLRNAHFNAGDSAVSSYTSFGNYTPKNKKLFTYPYNFYHVDNGDGASLNLRYEFFQNQGPQFNIEGCMTSPVQLRLTPVNYKNVNAENSHEDRAEFLTISSYPICSWNYDTYRAWVAQNSVPLEIQGATVGASLALGIATGGVGLAITAGSAIASALNVLSKSYTASIQADTCKGNINSGNVNFASKKQTFFGGRCRITADYAEVIDKFFTMYGYAFNKFGIPNPSNRTKWYYVKTIGAKVVGECPADDIKKICEIYDNGITFWHNPSEVGRYDLTNTPSSEV